jgi:chloride channel protein, CIC family
VSPAGHHLGPFVILVPVAGALVIGVMARYGSERIRGHGIPEAIEAILISGSRVEPKVALLKPVSSAISIGIVGVLIVKSAIWAISLGSGTSGGVLAPLLMIGGALGGLEARALPWEGAGFWPLVSMGAILGGTMRSPLTAVVFALELTHDVNIMLPLLLAVTIAHGFTVLTLRRSILTEKVARRGYHLSREYAIDPLEIVFAREVMRPPEPSGSANPQQPGDVVAYPDEPLRVIVYRMAETGRTEVAVVSREDCAVVGVIALNDLLTARTRILDAERRRERVLGAGFRLPTMFGGESDSDA